MADESFKKEFLEIHNALRQRHCTPPLTMSKELCASAQEWATLLTSIQKLERSGTKNGENIYIIKTGDPKKLTGKAVEAVESWYSEIKDYKWDSPAFNEKTAQFTQVVWMETTEVGLGLASDAKNNVTYLVAQYNPPGNKKMAGVFQANIMPIPPHAPIEAQFANAPK